MEKKSIDLNIEKKFAAQRKNIIELENELDYTKEQLEKYKETNQILNNNVDLFRKQLEELEAELRKYKTTKNIGDIEGF